MAKDNRDHREGELYPKRQKKDDDAVDDDAVDDDKVDDDKVDDDALVKSMIVSSLLWRYARMSWFLSNAYCPFMSPRIPTIPRNNMEWLPVEHCMMVGGVFVASVAMQLSMCAGTYKQPIENVKQCCEWMRSIMQRVTTGLVRKTAIAYYDAGKACMFSKKFAIGVSFLEKAIELDHNGARALLAYYLMRGREGLPANRGRASDLAYDGAMALSRECELLQSILCSADFMITWKTDTCENALDCYSTAMESNMTVSDIDLAKMLHNLAAGLMCNKYFARYCVPYQESPKEVHHLMNEIINTHPEKLHDLGNKLLMENQKADMGESNYFLATRCNNHYPHSHPFLAAHYMKKAADLGHPDALFHLALWYMCGRGVDEDREKGLCLMNRAKKAGSVSAKEWKEE